MIHQQLESFFDEMEKVGRSYLKDFAAGVDPTGTSTFQYGMRDAKRWGSASKARQAVNTLGGVVGGATVIPAAVGGVVGAFRGAAAAPGGPKAKLVAAGKGLATGALSPFRSIHRGLKASSALKAAETGAKLSPEQLGHLGKFMSHELPIKGNVIGDIATPSRIQTALSGMPPAAVAKLRKRLGGEIASGVGALGLSGAVSGGSAFLQYGKGGKTQESVNRQLARARNQSQNFGR